MMRRTQKHTKMTTEIKYRRNQSKMCSKSTISLLFFLAFYKMQQYISGIIQTHLLEWITSVYMKTTMKNLNILKEGITMCLEIN